MTTQIANIDQIKTDVTVGMDDLVNVFIAKYETSLIDQRTKLQDQLKGLNKIIHGLGETAIKDAKTIVLGFQVPTFNNGYVSINTTIGDNFKLDWEHKHVSFTMSTVVKSLVKVDWNTESGACVNSAVPLHSKLVEQYDQIMDEKRDVMEELTKINNDLRDVSRKERQVRGKIAERKFVASGLEDLLADQELVKLIQL